MGDGFQTDLRLWHLHAIVAVVLVCPTAFLAAVAWALVTG